MSDPNQPTAVVTAEGGAAPAERKTFEDWVASKKIASIDLSTGRASGVVKGKRRFKTRGAALVNAARSKGAIPIGRLMTEADFDKALAEAGAIVLRSSSNAPR